MPSLLIGWSPTTCDHTAPPLESLGSNAGTSAGDGRTIELRIRISRRGGGSARCSGSRARVQPRNFLAQLALGCHHHLSSSADGGIEACSGRGIVLEAGEVEPPEVAVEVFCGDAAMGAQEGFEALVATVDGLDV